MLTHGFEEVGGDGPAMCDEERNPVKGTLPANWAKLSLDKKKGGKGKKRKLSRG